MRDAASLWRYDCVAAASGAVTPVCCPYLPALQRLARRIRAALIYNIKLDLLVSDNCGGAKQVTTAIPPGAIATKILHHPSASFGQASADRPKP